MAPAPNDSKVSQEDPKDAVSNVESSVGIVKVSKRDKASRHCRKWWWLWLIGFLIFALVIIIIVIYAIVPAVAQDKVDDTSLALNSLNILAPTATGFSITINTTITGDTGLAKGGHLDPFDIKFTLDGNDPDTQSFLTLPVNRVNIAHSMPVTKTNYSVTIENEDSFEGYAVKLLEEETLKVVLKGRTTLWLGAIHTKVNYNEVLTMKGLNKLSGMAIKSYELSSSENANIEGKVLIPNPSVVTVQMGDVNLDIALNGTKLGTGVIPDLILTPGNHQYTFKALIDESKLFVLANTAQANGSVIITSNGTEVDGTLIPWLSAPLQGLNSTVPFDVSS